MKKLIVRNRPETAYIWEFEVVIPRGDGTYDHIWYCANGPQAKNVAKLVEGVILHNSRIQGKVRA